MKKLSSIVLLSACALFSFGNKVVAQEASVAQTLKEYLSDESSLFEEVSGIKKKTDKFNLLLHMQGSLDGHFDDSRFQNGNFNMEQLRIEARGNVNSWLSYRWRQRLNRTADGSNSVDNLPDAIDVAGIGLQLSPKFGMFIGKQGAAFGGIEYDLNPIEIYQYAQFLERTGSFFTGVNFNYAFNAKHELNFQIVNNRTEGTAQELYGVDDIKEAKVPFIYSLNWNGELCSHWKTRWSVSFMNETADDNKIMVMLGNEFNFGKFGGYLDYMYSREQLDRKGFVRDVIKNDADLTAIRNLSTSYHTAILQLNYRFTPHWNLKGKGSIDSARAYDDVQYEAADKTVDVSAGTFMNTLSYTVGMEYYPMKDSNLHFFLMYSGKKAFMKEKAKNFNLENTCVSKVSLGFVYQMKMF